MKIIEKMPTDEFEFHIRIISIKNVELFKAYESRKIEDNNFLLLTETDTFLDLIKLAINTRTCLFAQNIKGKWFYFTNLIENRFKVVMGDKSAPIIFYSKGLEPRYKEKPAYFIKYFEKRENVGEHFTFARGVNYTDYFVPIIYLKDSPLTSNVENLEK